MVKRYLILLTLISLFGAISRAALDSTFYTETSVLSSGKWVKVGVDKSGVYEITYDELETMGFADPSKVGVYGRGGGMLPIEFTTNTGRPAFNDDISPVKVLHKNRKLYFYAVGPEKLTFVYDKDAPTKGYFTRESLNIYSTRGYYFLTDSTEPVSVVKRSFDSTADGEVDRGVSFVYHEKDSIQNTTNTGQLFWGEYIGLPHSKKRAWKAEMPDALAGEGMMQCALYFSNQDGVNANVNFGFENTKYFTTPYKPLQNNYFAVHLPSVGKIEIPGKKGTVFTEFTYNNMLDQSYLDFWVVSYNRTMPTMKDADGNSVNQQFFVLPDVDRNTVKKFSLQNAESLMVWEVSDPENPEYLSFEHTANGAGYISVANNGMYPHLIVMDTQLPQMKISGFDASFNAVENQNLHAYKKTGADFVIICTPVLREYAEEIAQIHRDADNIEVIVATTEECYNEFSAGVPDPMAYRSFMKMLYMSPKQPKNLLLFGPLYGDFRGVKVERDPLDGIIAFQSPAVSIARGAHNINDFYGMMDDQFNEDYYERNPVQVGVAILPIKFKSEAEIVVDKIRNYLNRTDFAYYLNRITTIGGIGDEHTHDAQVADIDTHIRLLDYKSSIITPLSIDTYGNSEAQKKFYNQLNDGCQILTYFGHGAEQFLGKNRYFFGAGDVFKIRNKYLPFAGFGGCQITNTDRGMRGLGETIVTATPYGCIGSIVSARETWSGQNMEFFKLFFTCLYKRGSSTESAHSYNPRTIGEVYASVKNYSTYSNELAYQLLADPAIVIPTVNRLITVNNPENLEAVAGEMLKIKGIVNAEDNESTDDSFNGQLVVRLMEPEKIVACGMIESKENPGELKYTYRDSQISMTVGEVKNGKFEFEIPVPASASVFDSQNAILQLCAYDPSTRVGAGGAVNMPYAVAPGNQSTESKDQTPPVIELFAFDPAECAIALQVSDNYALNYTSDPLLKGIYLFIDGKERKEALFTEPVIEIGRAAYSKNIYLDALSYGEHSARLKVKDSAGNTTEEEFTFIYSPEQTAYTISLAEDTEAGQSVIKADGTVPQKATLYIIDNNGNEVWSGSFNGAGTVWNRRDNAGNAVAPGHYKGYILEKGNSTNKGHSATIDIPVV